MLRRWAFSAALLASSCLSIAQQSGSIEGLLLDQNARPVAGATVLISGADRNENAVTDAEGRFRFAGVPFASYAVSARRGETMVLCSKPVAVQQAEVELSLQFASSGELVLGPATHGNAGSTGTERLTSKSVSGLPLNKRDFSQLLVLAAGTQTDTNGAANFTQQFAVNGERGTTAVFEMDGITVTDPELGGAAFSNFNLDAIQEIRANSGVMPAEIGHGAASFTDIVTKTGTKSVHGNVFEFVRNAAFDARNFFDRRSPANPGRLPPFQRDEFGLTNGGPLFLPGIYDGRGRTFYFAQYQGFRQNLGTTQILSVPTLDERRGLDTTAFPGDTLIIPVNPQIASVLRRYPLPNDPQGPFGARTYATSSKVTTVTDQFSTRIDHRVSDKDQLFGRFNLNNVNGPTTNPDQTAIDPSFAIRFLDRQRNAGLTYVRTVSSHLTLTSTIGYTRTTPLFPPENQTQPALKFADSLYTAFNAPGGTVSGAYGNLFQARQTVAWTRGDHAISAGFEVWANRDTTVFGLAPNGEYMFGGGTVYSPVEIQSLSGRHDIAAGQPLPDSLSAFLSGTPFSYDISVSPLQFPQGDHIGWTALRRYAYNAYFQDTWKATQRLMVSYGLRYEFNTPFNEPADRSSGPDFVQTPAGVEQRFLVNLQPAMKSDWNGWGPRLALDFAATDKLVLHAASAITTILPNLFQNDFITASAPFVFIPYLSAVPGSPVTFQNAVSHLDLPVVYTTSGQPFFMTGKTTDVPPNTVMDVQRFEDDLAAITPGHQIRPLTVYGNSKDFHNGYIATYTAGLERAFSDIKMNAAYVATVGVGLAAMSIPNGYGGAEPGFAPFTNFDSSGRVIGGFGPEFLLTNRSHSTFHSLQTGVQKSSVRFGLGFQASYTFSKSLDDVSSILGSGLTGSSSGTVQPTQPQNPSDTRAEKGPSTFDVRHALSVSFVADLPFDRWSRQDSWIHKVASGWQLFSISTLTSGLPFSVYSGIQQTAAGSGGVDRPDQVGDPVLSTSRKVREDYFGLGAANASYFFIPINVPGGTGPNHGRFGSLGRDTFRGPALREFDVSLVKETPLVREDVKLQFRAEFFNVFNLVNFGLPSNVVLGPGFGVISRTAAPSRQIQLSVKVLY